MGRYKVYFMYGVKERSGPASVNGVLSLLLQSRLGLVVVPFVRGESSVGARGSRGSPGGQTLIIIIILLARRLARANESKHLGK